MKGRMPLLWKVTGSPGGKKLAQIKGALVILS
jgi:hypothetical protein